MRSSHDVGVCGSREARRSISNLLIPADDGHVLLQVCAKHVRGDRRNARLLQSPAGFQTPEMEKDRPHKPRAYLACTPL